MFSEPLKRNIIYILRFIYKDARKLEKLSNNKVIFITQKLSMDRVASSYSAW